MRLLIRRGESTEREQCVRGSHRRSTKFDKFIAREMRSADAIRSAPPLRSALGMRRPAPRIMSYLCIAIVATQLQHIVAAVVGSVSLTRCRQLFTFPLSALSSVGRAGLLAIETGPPGRAAAQPKMCQPLEPVARCDHVSIGGIELRPNGNCARRYQKTRRESAPAAEPSAQINDAITAIYNRN